MSPTGISFQKPLASFIAISCIVFWNFCERWNDHTFAKRPETDRLSWFQREKSGQASAKIDAVL